ncbi:OAS1 [Branchiostoma lanceolatum]|uniref:OAS1 protein n=1 Tax=Branchiostoma lanceolatum TaxID=7740 RepID=A0A8K0A038_BRALA|nr:OAS1 [Branchiostoma lanceolatum]
MSKMHCDQKPPRGQHACYELGITSQSKHLCGLCADGAERTTHHFRAHIKKSERYHRKRPVCRLQIAMAHFSGDASFLGLTSERELNAHIDRELQMTESDRVRYNRVLDGLYRTLQTEYNNLTVNRMVKGGSYGRGTALKDRSDLDVVLFFNGIPSMRDFLAQQSRIIGHVATTLERSQWARDNGVCQVRAQQNAATLSLKLSGGHQMDVDIVPAFDNLGPLNEKRKREEVYRAMRGDPEPPYKYSASFIGLQVDFVRDRPARLKNLIRLVKSWKKVPLHLNIYTNKYCERHNGESNLIDTFW